MKDWLLPWHSTAPKKSVVSAMFLYVFKGLTWDGPSGFRSSEGRTNLPFIAPRSEKEFLAQLEFFFQGLGEHITAQIKDRFGAGEYIPQLPHRIYFQFFRQSQSVGSIFRI